MQSTSKAKLISNSSWQILFNILRAVIGFISTAFIANQLGPEKFGEIQYVFSIHYFLQLTELLSHHSILKKMLLDKKFTHDEIMGSSFVINAVSTLTVLVTSSIIASFLYSDNDLLLVFVAAQIGLLARTFNNTSFYFDSKLESKKSAFSQFTGNFLSNVARVIVLLFTKSLFIQAILFSFQFIVTSSTNIIFYLRSNNSIFSWQINKSVIKYILLKSMPLLFTALTSIIFLKIDIIMLEHLASSTAVGIYSVAVKLSEPWFFISGAIITSFFPSVLMIKTKTIKGYYYKLTRLNSIIFVLGISISIFMTLTAYLWIHYIFGEEFYDSIKILQIHVWGLAFIFWNNLQHLWELKEDFLEYALVKAIFTSILNVVLNLYWIPEYQGVGAAYATVISYFVAGMLFNISTKKSRLYLKIQLKSILFYKYISLKELKEVLGKS
ncbi:MAG: O-antigen/teichoic acid export membrane protein [Bacteriovoracaceae bacterium]|jgi:O-antigen/teichoic acid export membrane protein